MNSTQGRVLAKETAMAAGPMKQKMTGCVVWFRALDQVPKFAEKSWVSQPTVEQYFVCRTGQMAGRVSI